MFLLLPLSKLLQANFLLPIKQKEKQNHILFVYAVTDLLTVFLLQGSQGSLQDQ